ncbi:MAG TPA: PAS domain S-box protein, partial [Luteolibacter sp.]
MSDRKALPLRILMVEDRSEDAELMVRELRRAGFAPDWERVDTEADYVARLRPELDIVLSDFSMPDFSGLRALEVLRERGLDIPFILVSGTIGEDVAVTAMRLGASDYLLKDRLTRLGPAVEHAIGQRRLRKESEHAEKAMRESEHKYRHLFESLSEPAFLIENASRRILDVNICAQKLLGLTRTEILGKDAWTLLPAAAAPEIVSPVTSIAECKSGLEEAEILTADGSRVAVLVSVAPVDLYGRSLLLTLLTDITARKQVEVELR